MNEPPFSPNKLAERWDCSKQYIYKLMRDGKLPHFKLGGKLVRIPADAIQGKTREEFVADLPKAPRARPSLASKIKRGLLPPAPDSGHVYFIRCKNYVKVGYAVEVPSRRKGLQTGNPFDLDVMGSFKAHPTTESDIHDVLKHHAHRGEWFRLTPVVRKMIAELCDG